MSRKNATGNDGTLYGDRLRSPSEFVSMAKMAMLT
jgi:hypothetical protein